MDITYLGNTSFKLRGKEASVVVNHENKVMIHCSSHKPEPYVIVAPGEYEVGGVGVFGWRVSGELNTIYSIMIDGVRVVHMGGVKKIITPELIEGLGSVDVLLIPVNGQDSLSASDALTVIEQLSPSLVVPMSTNESFDDFLKAAGTPSIEAVDKLKVTPETLPEQTQIIRMKTA